MTARNVQVTFDGNVLAYGRLDGQAWRKFLTSEFPQGAQVLVQDHGHSYRYEVAYILDLVLR